MMDRRTLLGAGAALLSGCGQTLPPLPVIPRPIILDPLMYLVQTGPMGTRRDWPLPDGYVVQDNVALTPQDALQSWRFGPGLMDYSRGDGGQVLSVGTDGYVRIVATRDGGTPDLQFFVGGTGWIAFGLDASEEWRHVTAALKRVIGTSEYNGEPLDPAFTRYRHVDMVWQFAVDGNIVYRILPTIVSEHYNGPSIREAAGLERSWFAAGQGLIRWEAWGKTPPPVDLSQRYFPVEHGDQPPGMILQDVRTYTNVTTRPVAGQIWSGQ